MPLVVVVAACGRIGFDPLSDGGGVGVDAAGVDAARVDASIVDDAGSDAGVAWPSFGPPRLSSVSTDRDDWTPELSRDGLLLFGAAYGEPGAVGQDDLWMTTRTSLTSPFAPRALIAGLGTAGRDYGPAISADGLTLFYASGASGFSEPRAIFQATRASRAAAFGSPTEVVALTGGTVARDPAISADGLTIYFDSDRAPTHGRSDIWYATRATPASPWSAPVNLTEVNTSAIERDAFISSDGLTLFYASDRPGGMGSQDLWVTVRPDLGSPFAPPRNLTELNSVWSQGNLTMSDDGLAMWDSTRPGGPGGTYGYDIWEAQLVR